MRGRSGFKTEIIRPHLGSPARATTLTLLFLVLLAGTALGNSIVVHTGERIQAAIDSAGPGDIVEVESGTYTENLNVNKRLILVGKDMGLGLPSVSAGGSGSAIALVTDGVTIEGFVVTGSGTGPGDAGIAILSNGNSVTGCTVTGNGNCGILLSRSSYNTLVRNIASDNVNAGILLDNSTHNTITFCDLGGNGYGTRFITSHNNTVQYNAFRGNREAGMMINKSSNQNTITGNVILMNPSGILMEISRGNTITENNVTGNGIGVNIINHNDTEAIRPIDNPGKYGGVSIKYKPSTEVDTIDVRHADVVESATKNIIYNNSLVENGENALDDGVNQWDNGSLGNHYDDHDEPMEGCRDRNRDGICDSVYRIPGGSAEDTKPLAPEDAVPPRFGSTGLNGTRMKIYQNYFVPGGKIDLKVTLPLNFSGWAGVVSADLPHVQADKDRSLTYQKVTQDSKRLAFDAPMQEGSYSVRIYSDSGEEMAALGFMVEVPTLTIFPESVKACDPINVSYSGAPGFEGDWIGLYPAGAQDTSPYYRKYLDGSNNGTLTFYAPSRAGSFNLRMFQDDKYNRIATSSTVSVATSAGVRIHAEPDHVSPGQTVYVHFWGALPDSTIGMYGMTSPDKNMLNMIPTGGEQCGTLVFRAPGPGRYDFRLFENNVYRKHMGASNVVQVG